jgi:hypothetical protein
MKLYHGTNTNALELLVKNKFTLFSKRKMLEAGVSVLAGEWCSDNGFIKGMGVDTVSLGSDRKKVLPYAQQGFDYAFLREMFLQTQQALNPNTCSDDEMILLASLNLALYHFQTLSVGEKRSALNPEPLLLELECDDARDLGNYACRDMVGGFQYRDQVDLSLNLMKIYTSFDGIDFVKKTLDPILDFRIAVDSELEIKPMDFSQVIYNLMLSTRFLWRRNES